MTELAVAVPDPRMDLIPSGWWQDVATPRIESADWDELGEWEAQISAVADYCDSLSQHGPLFEYRAALRLIERRRGELIGPSRQGERSDLQLHPREGEVDVPQQTASKYRQIADHWELIRAHLIDCTPKADPRQATQTACLRVIREHTPAKPRGDGSDDVIGEGERYRALHGDFRERLDLLDDASVDLIVTDPPYPKEDLPLYSDLSKVASRLLGPRGILFVWTGQIFLPEVIDRLSENLTYGWTFALQLPGSGSRIMGRHIVQAWKPVLAFTVGTWPSGAWGDDVLVSPTREKDEYAWQQNAAPAQRLIERYSPPDGLVVDPFLGVGSFGRAALDAGRRFVGVELDGKRFDQALERLA